MAFTLGLFNALKMLRIYSPSQVTESTLGPGRPFRAFDRKLMILNVRLMHNE